jgi:hypothetical protein
LLLLLFPPRTLTASIEQFWILSLAPLRVMSALPQPLSVSSVSFFSTLCSHWHFANQAPPPTCSLKSGMAAEMSLDSLLHCVMLSESPACPRLNHRAWDMRLTLGRQSLASCHPTPTRTLVVMPGRLLSHFVKASLNYRNLLHEKNSFGFSHVSGCWGRDVSSRS